MARRMDDQGWRFLADVVQEEKISCFSSFQRKPGSSLNYVPTREEGVDLDVEEAVSGASNGRITS